MPIETCSYKISRGMFLSTNCKKMVAVHVNGRAYCKTHDPDFVAKKRQAREAMWADAQKRRNAEFERQALEHEYCRGLSNEELRKGRP